jgi:uncharacterized protein involved in type VI secretion and phage assembly
MFTCWSIAVKAFHLFDSSVYAIVYRCIRQEVFVGFIEVDIDRPIVTGVVYNGSHPKPTFSGAGALLANKTLSGIKSKEYKGGQYGELLFDDSTGQVRTKLSSEHAKTQLNLGYLIHPRSNGKGEAKGSLLDSFALLAALPAAQREQLEQMKSEDPFDPAPQDRKTPSKVTVSEDANEDDLKAKRQGKKVEQGLSTTKTRGVQMSHQWVVFNILNTESKGLAKSHKATLLKSIGQFEKRVEVQENPQAPYDRWIIMVTGKQKVRHEVRHGHHHEIRRPMVELPNNILWK